MYQILEYKTKQLKQNKMTQEEKQLIVNAVKTCPESARTIKDKLIIELFEEVEELKKAIEILEEGFLILDKQN